MDALSLKRSFKEVNNLGLNYLSLIYNTNELKYKHCPVTFNFLSTEFTFENEFFESYELSVNREDREDIHYGIDFNILNLNGDYLFYGECGDNTYIYNQLSVFIENIKYELEFIANHDFKNNNIVCNLSQHQLEVYFNEKEKNMGTAYSTWDIIDCPPDLSIDEIKSAINRLIDKHPILKGRILDNDNIPLLICDSYPSIKVTDIDDYSSLIKRFDMEKNLSRFFIIDKKNSYHIFYDIHHVINDGVGFKIIGNNLADAFEDCLNPARDVGFVYASLDSYESEFLKDYEKAHEFYNKHLARINEANSLPKDSNGSNLMVSLPIHNIRRDVEEFAKNNNITVGTFLNAVFAYTYSRFIKSDKVYYNFVEHGRHEEYAQNALGMFARTVPILIDCKNRDVKNYLNYFSNLILNSMLNDIYPYRLLACEFNLNNDVLFEYNYDLNDVSNIKDEIIVKEDIIDAFSEFFCIINDLDDGYVIHVKQTNKFSIDCGINFAKLYVKILKQMLNKNKLNEIIG